MGKQSFDTYLSSGISNSTMTTKNQANRHRWGEQSSEGFSSFTSKRLRGDFYSRNHVFKRVQGKSIESSSFGEIDLREKLTRKRQNHTKLNVSKPLSRSENTRRSSGIICPSQSARGSTSLKPRTINHEPSASIQRSDSTAKLASSAVSFPLANVSVEEHQTVSGFMNSIGLEKYNVLFQAEEVDMTILRHMGEKDLKDMGVPMGPRKKILLALAPQKKCCN